MEYIDKTYEEILSEQYGQPIKTTGEPDFDQRVADSEAQRNMNNFGQPIKTTGGPDFDQRVENDEMIAATRRNEDKDKNIILDNLLKSLPENSEDLKVALGLLDYRMDFMKKLVEGYYQHFLNVATMYQKDFSDASSKIVNESLSNLLNLIETLKLSGYNFGSTPDSFKKTEYDPNKPEINIYEVQSYMFNRRKNGANVQIAMPVNYYKDDNQPTFDGVSVVYCVNEHLQGNPYMDSVWKKYCPQSDVKSVAK